MSHNPWSPATGLVASGLLLVAVAATPTVATVLTFDFGGSNSQPPPPSYGMRVGSGSFPQPPNFSYGPDFGPTPNVSVTCDTNLRLGGSPITPDPSRVFGDLTNVLYPDRSAGFNVGIIQITLWADPGFQVNLFRFDLAAITNTITGAGEDLPAKSIQVLDGTGTPLYSLQYDPTITDHDSPLSTHIPGGLPLRHKRFSRDLDPLIADRIIIRIDVTQILTIGGSKIDRFGIDNIAFGQTVQLPTHGAASIVLGTAGMLAALRRRRARPSAGMRPQRFDQAHD